MDSTIQAGDAGVKGIAAAVKRPVQKQEISTLLAVALSVHLVCAIWLVTWFNGRGGGAVADSMATMAPPAKLDPSAYARGQQLYAMACVACHGPNGGGVAGLGKDLVNSSFVHSRSDQQLTGFITAGRGVDDSANTTHVAMPPKGGRADFDEQNISDVVAYLRGLGDPRRVPTWPLPSVEVVIGGVKAPTAGPAAAASVVVPPTPVAVAAPVASTPVAAPVKAPVSGSSDSQSIARGKIAFVSCIACHGKDARGVKNLGKDLVSSAFVAKLDDAALADFVKTGRGPTDPANTTKVTMPPKGGNPALKDEQIRDIVSFLRSLEKTANVSTTDATASAKPASGNTGAVALNADAVARGKKAWMSCVACHGKGAMGVKNLGKDLVHSKFVAGLNDDGLLEFIKKGRGPTDPGNTTKIAMPLKGGNPALKDEQLRDLISFIRSLQLAAGTH